MLKFDRQGLIPAVLQDANTREVLMVAYMNEEAVRRTMDSGDAWFWSRSRQELWHKGDTSGNFQHVVRAQADCDSDAILLEVNPEGPACHTGATSCFFQSLEDTAASPATPLPLEDHQIEGAPGVEVLEELTEVIAQRHREMPDGSYVAKLLAGGPDAIVRKVGEEATEVIIAGKNDQNAELVWEVADLWFHTLVLLESKGATLADVCAELARRRQ
ncbi:MAG TPA: bifunctional phosphoribosyl-AMP cyclohydrolase/phosphoribosyl-ATP diphosphatase HisIE [Chloroflexota bacterium]